MALFIKLCSQDWIVHLSKSSAACCAAQFETMHGSFNQTQSSFDTIHGSFDRTVYLIAGAILTQFERCSL